MVQGTFTVIVSGDLCLPFGIPALRNLLWRIPQGKPRAQRVVKSSSATMVTILCSP